MLAIDNIRRVATDEVFIETHISDKGLGRVEKIFPCGDSIDLMSSVVMIAIGLDRIWRQSSIHLSQQVFPQKICSSDGERARFHAVAREGMPEFLNIACHEAGSYDVLVNHLFGKRETWRRPITTER